MNHILNKNIIRKCILHKNIKIQNEKSLSLIFFGTFYFILYTII
jgi:hypothetical protein